MKKVLVTGAAGEIGLLTLKYLLSEGKYEITALDLKNKNNISKLRKYRKRINILYGDVCDRVLMEALTKDHDIIIHLAGVLPPFANMKKELASAIDYEGTENIARAITYYNPKCHLFYASTMSLYENKDQVSTKTTISINEGNYYNEAKYNAERLIKSKLKYYTIYRLPKVLGNPLKDPFPYNISKKDEIDYLTKEDAAYAFVKGINYKEELNKKTYNVANEDKISYKELLNIVLENVGISWRYILNRLFVEKEHISYNCLDKEELNDIINYKNDSLRNYIDRLKYAGRKRRISKILAKPFISKKK